METSILEFRNLNGELAYQVFRQKTFNNLRSLKSIKMFYENLELIVYQDKAIVAYRFDTPENLKRYITNDGAWRIYDIESFSGEIWLNNVFLIYKDLW